MLEKVRHTWIKGLLEPSLSQLARIELGLETKPDVVDRPFDLLVQRPKQAPHPLPPGTPISQIFDDAGNALLILGEPGAGKTTLLLEFTRDLLERAQQDERHLIPVVFTLSSWAEQRLTLSDWLVDELSKRYDVPHKLAKAWVDDELILLLLDGLDEVAAEHRDACVKTINDFVRAHGLLPLVVCSRIADYEALGVRLRVPSAVLIQALCWPQVQQYIEQAGAALAGLRTVLHNDTTLRELLDTPLMLSVVVLAYRGYAAEEIHAAGTVEEHRRHIFAAYTDAMFKRGAPTTIYTREQTEHWLTCLAKAMKDHSQTIFYLEWMRPDWLPGQGQQQQVKLLRSVMIGHLVGLSVGLGFGLSQGLYNGLSQGVVSGLVSGLIFGLISGLILLR
jgi:GTPase SAR1 family protein